MSHLLIFFNMNEKIKLFIMAVTVGLFSLGCEKSPINRLINPSDSYTNSWSGNWMLYDDELRTDGDIKMFTTLDGQELDFESRENPYSGTKCIKFSWDGSSVIAYELGTLKNCSESDFVGFKFVVEKKGSSAPKTKDLTQGGFKKLVFWARGSLNENVYLRVEANSDNPNFSVLSSGAGIWMGRVTNGWQKYEIDLDPTLNSLTAIKDYIRIILRYDEDANQSTNNDRQGNGGTVYIDNIELTR